MVKRNAKHYARGGFRGGGIKGLLGNPAILGAVGGVAHAMLLKANLGYQLSGAVANLGVGLLGKNPTALYIGGGYAGAYAGNMLTGTTGGSLGWNF